MPFYRFLIHGRDTSLPDDTKGFFTTRHAYGSNQSKAADKVFAKLMREFTVGVSASIWNAGPPLLIIEDAYRIGFHQLRSAPNKGSTFYDERNAERDEPMIYWVGLQQTPAALLEMR